MNDNIDKSHGGTWSEDLIREETFSHAGPVATRIHLVSGDVIAHTAEGCRCQGPSARAGLAGAGAPRRDRYEVRRGGGGALDS